MLGAWSLLWQPHLTFMSAPRLTLDPASCKRSAALDDDALLAECEMQCFVASGPGGQHRNKTETAVRLWHRPTGLQVTATERRSQLLNRAAAIERLRARLEQASHVERPRLPTKVSRGAKRRRLENKRRQSEKKRVRRGED